MDPVEVEAFLACARGHDIGKAVGLQRFGLPVTVERTVVIGLTEHDVVGARIVWGFIGFGVVGSHVPGGPFVATLFRRRLKQRVFRHFLGKEGVELEIAEL